MRNKTCVAPVLLLSLSLFACRAHRPVVEIQADPARESSLTQNSRVNSSLKITAVSIPSQAITYESLQVTIIDPDQADRTQTLDSYKLNHAIPVAANKTYTFLVRAKSGDEVLYSNEYCRGKKNFRSQLGVTLLTVSLCEKAEPADAEAEMDSDPTAD